MAIDRFRYPWLYRISQDADGLGTSDFHDLVTAGGGGLWRAIPIWMALALALAACTPKPPAHVGTVDDAEEVSMAKCTFLKELSNTKSWSDRMLGHVFAAYDQKALDDARFDVRRQAKEMGATHLVWLGGADSSRVSARAYRCR